MAENIFAIDPGLERSAWVALDEDGSVEGGIEPNETLILHLPMRGVFAIEMIASYGMAVGADIFETCVWIGRFVQMAHIMACQATQPLDLKREAVLVYRKDVKLHVCGTCKAKDSNIRQALIDRFPRTGGGKTPQIGTKKAPGPLYGFKTDMWAALAVAVTVRDGRT